MSKVYGTIAAYTPLREERTRTVASYDLQPAVPDASPSGSAALSSIVGAASAEAAPATWHEVYFYHKRTGHPTLAQIKAAIIADINARTDERILTGFSWNGKPVWLSQENQFNYKAAYDLALQTDGQSLPVKFKLGEDADGLPVYHTFTALSAFTDFYTRAIAFINQCLNDGWQMKDGMDWTPYAAAVPDASPSGQE